MSSRFLSLPVVVLLLLSSCDATDRMNSRGAIVLGDSSLIVTETDSQYLRDFITDFQPARSAASPVSQPDTVRKADTVVQQAPAELQPAASVPASGLTVDFKEIRIFIADIETRTYDGSPKNGNSAAYQLTGGKLNGNKLQITGSGRVERISQRYQTSVVLKNELGTLLLESLNYTSDWRTLKAGETVPITGLADQQLQYTKVSQAGIKNAVTKSLRGKRISPKKEQEYLNDIRNVRSVNQKPLDVVLRTVIWQISGKDSKGKPFSKELRIDLSV